MSKGKGGRGGNYDDEDLPDSDDIPHYLPPPEPEQEPELQLPDSTAGVELAPAVWCLKCEDQPAARGARFCSSCEWKLMLESDEDRQRERDR